MAVAYKKNILFVRDKALSMIYVYASLFVLGVVLVHGSRAEAVYSQRELTVRVEPGAIECFYERARKNQIIDFEYQVVDGGHGDFDISFELQNPNGHPIVTEYKKSDNIHRFDAVVDGDYRYCFDNTFSSFNTKTVFFELIIEWDGDQGGDGGGSESKHGAKEGDWGQNILDKAVPDELLKERVSSFCAKKSLACINLKIVFFLLFSSPGSRDSGVSSEIAQQFKHYAALIGCSEVK